MTRNAKILLMTDRAEAWRLANGKKIPEIIIWGLVAHGGLLRTTLDFAYSSGWVRSNRDGFEFMKALARQGEVSPTVAMFLEMLDRLEKRINEKLISG
jgi:hypothetical protein